MNTDQLVKRLERLGLDEGQPDWADVLRRASSSAQPEERIVVRKRSSRRLMRPRILALVCAVIVVAAAAALAPGWFGGHNQNDLLQQALAAVPPGPVVHVVLEYAQASTATTSTVVDLGSGQSRTVMHTTEIWWDESDDVVHAINSVNGTVMSDELATRGGYRILEPNGQLRSFKWPPRLGGHLSPPSPLTSFFTGYRDALATHEATQVGLGKINGHDVVWLRFRVSVQVQGHLTEGFEEVAVDRHTFKPVALRYPCSRCTTAPQIETIATLESVPESKANFALAVGHPEARVAQYGASYRVGNIQSSSIFLGRPTLWAGAKIATTKLSRVEFANTFNYSSRALHPPATDVIARGRGITFYYGSPNTQVTIAETADTGFSFHGFNMETLAPDGQPLTNAQTILPPEGQMILTNTGGDWTGQLRKNGLQIEIEARTRQQILTAARALRTTR